MKLKSAVGLTAVIALAVVGLSATPSLAAPKAIAAATTSGTAAIVGTISETGTTEQPIQLQVNLYDSSGNRLDATYQNRSHQYAFSGLAAGSYKIEAEPTQPLAYESTFYGGVSSLAAATVITVADGQQFSADVALLPGATISGTVTGLASPSVPLNRVFVQAYPRGATRTSSGSTYAFTDASGNYSLIGLSPGSYSLKFDAGSAAGVDYTGQWFDAANSQDNSGSVAVTQGQTVSGTNQTLTTGGTIGGFLTDTHGNPIKGTAVVYSAGTSEGPGSLIQTATVASDGSYSISRLPLGSYKVGFTTVVDLPQNSRKVAGATPTVKLAASTGNYYSGYSTTSTGALAPSYPYIPQWFSGHSAYSNATVVKISTPGQTYTKINASLVYDPSFLQTWAQESTTGTNPSEKLCQCGHADPINTATGEYYDNKTDLSLPGAGPAVAISRSYSSTNAAVASPLGYGWASNLGTSLSTVTQGNGPTPQVVQVTQENGSTAQFTLNTSGEYVAPSRVLATLSYDPNQSQWTFIRQSNDRFVFDSTGKLLTASDSNGNTETYSYDTSGKVVSISGSGSRSISLTWTGSLITGLTDSANRTVTYGYDSSSNLTSVTDPAGNVTGYVYDTGHRITKITTPNKGITTNTYDSTGKVTSQSDPLGRVTSFAYAGTTPGSLTTTMTAPDGSKTVEAYTGGLLTSETIASGTSLAATTAYAYDYSNNVTSITDPLGNVTKLTYDTQGNRLTTTDARGATVTSTYDFSHNLLTTLDPLGNLTSYTYDGNNNETSKTSPSGRVTTWTYNSDGTLATIVNARGKTTSFTYNSVGLPVSSTDPDNYVTAQTYTAAGYTATTTAPGSKTASVTTNANGLVLTSTDPLGKVTTSTYDADGNVLTVKDPLGNVTTNTYDLADELTSSKDALGNTTTYKYSPKSQLISTTDPLGNTTTQTYNGLGKISSITDADKHTTSYTYDLDKSLLSTVLPSGQSSTLTYDANRNVATSTDPTGNKTTFVYNSNNQVTTQTDPLGRKTTYAYTKDGQQSGSTLPGGATTSATYDANGNTVSEVNADGKTTTYSYDAADLPNAKTLPGGLKTKYDYNTRALLNSTTKPDATTLSNSYDANGRTTKIHSSVTGSTDITYAYDADGRRTTMTDETGTSTFTYDALSRMTGEKNGAGTALTYGYDKAGNRTTITYPSNRVVTYTYDAANLMTGVKDWANRTTTFSWTADSKIAVQTDPNAVTQTSTYDAADRITGLTTATSAATLAKYAYGYDAGSQLTTDSTTDPSTTSAGTSHSYTYDTLGQLASSTTSGTATPYAATAAGLLSKLGASTLTTNAAQEVTAITPATGPATSYTYSPNGERTTGTVAANGTTAAATTSYTWNAYGNLASVALPGSAGTVAYKTNGDGLRQTRTLGTTTTKLLWSSSFSVPALLDDGTTSYIYGPSGQAVEQINDSTQAVQYLFHDQLGSIRLITDSTGAAVGTYTYDPYGQQTGHSGTATSALGYTGNLVDSSTGLVYLRARDLDTSTGQFLSIDPAVSTTGQAFAYARNNPLLGTDPSGLSSIFDGINWDTVFQATSPLIYNEVKSFQACRETYDSYNCSVMTFDPMYAALDGYTKEWNDAKAGCPASVIFQDALEAVGGVAGTIGLATGAAGGVSGLASRFGAGAAEAADLPAFGVVRSQLEAKFKHAADFGVTESRGAAGFDAYGKAVTDFVADPANARVMGTYRNQAAILSYNPETRLVVVQTLEGKFMSGWRMSAAQLAHVMNGGNLGGG